MTTLPVWIEVLVAAAALVGAIGVLWTKIIRPLIRFTSSVEEMLPLVRDLTSTFRDTPHAFNVLDEIVTQFRTNGGSSLRDVVNRLDAAAVASKTAADALKVGVETSRQLAERDREDYRDILLRLERLTVKVDETKGTAP